LSVIVLIALSVFFFLPNSREPFTSAQSARPCSGSGVLSKESKLFITKDNEKAASSYTDRIYKQINYKHGKPLTATPSDISTANTILQSIHMDKSFVIEKPVGMIAVELGFSSTVLYFVEASMINKGKNALSSSESPNGSLLTFYRYFQCLDMQNSVNSMFKGYRYLNAAETTNVIDERTPDTEQAKYNIPLGMLTGLNKNILTIEDAQLIAMGLGSTCNGFIAKVTPVNATLTDVNATLSDVNFVTSDYSFAKNSTRMDNLENQLESIIGQYEKQEEITSKNLKENTFVGFKKQITTTLPDDVLLSEHMASYKNAVYTNLTLKPNHIKIKDGHKLSKLPASARRYCNNGPDSRNCCIRPSDIKAIFHKKDGGKLDADLPTMSEFIGSENAEAAMAEFTCPYYIDGSLEGNVYTRNRSDGFCCRSVPSRGSLLPGMSVSDEDMYKGIMQENSSPYTCSRRSEFMTDPKCNARCEFIAKKRNVFRSNPKETAGAKEHPTVYRRDLKRCIYDSNKCDVPTVEACNAGQFTGECPPSACATTCNGLEEANWEEGVPNAIMQKEIEDRGMCRDGRTIYEKKGSMLDNYYTGLSILKELFANSKKRFAYGNTVSAKDPCADGCIDLSLREYGDVYKIGESKSGDVGALIPSVAAPPGSGLKEYRVVSYNSIMKLLRFEDENKNTHTLFFVGTPVEHLGANPSVTLAKCQGDCDLDSQCAGNLKCWQRDGNEPIPGCIMGGSGDISSHDYCYDPEDNK
jgi:hypothetical protein